MSDTDVRSVGKWSGPALLAMGRMGKSAKASQTFLPKDTRLILKTPSGAVQNIALATKKLLKHLGGEIDPAKPKDSTESKKIQADQEQWRDPQPPQPE